MIGILETIVYDGASGEVWGAMFSEALCVV